MPLVHSLSAALLGAAVLAAPVTADASASGPTVESGSVGVGPTLVVVSDPQNLPIGDPPRVAYFDWAVRGPIFRPGKSPLPVGPGQPLTLMRAHSGFLVYVNNTVRFIGDDGHRRRLVRVENPRLVQDAVASRDGKLVAIAVAGLTGHHQRVLIRRLSDGKLLAQRTFKAPVRVASFSQNRALLTPIDSCLPSCQRTLVTRWWKFRSGRLQVIDDTPRSEFPYDSISPNGDLSAAQVAVVRGDDHERVVTLPRRPSKAWHTDTDEWVLSWSPDDRYVLTVRDGSEHGWDSLTVRRATNGAVVTRFQGHSNLTVNGLWTPVWEDTSTLVFVAGYDCDDGCVHDTIVRCTLAGSCQQVAQPDGVLLSERRVHPS